MRHGFSLVELSIVLVILGLLTGGILSGQSLIRAAELRALTTDSERYVIAVAAFQDKYMALPGDMRTAVRFWGAQVGTLTDGVDSTCAALTYASPATGKPTCNGNGDGIIAGSNRYEIWRAWHHLANSGLVEGSFAGVNGDAVQVFYANPGFNVPHSKVDGNAGWAFWHSGSISTGGAFFSSLSANTLRMGCGNNIDGCGIGVSEMWNVDTKSDDGKPGTGRWRTLPATPRPNCASSDDPATAIYVVTSSTKNCNPALIFGQ